MVIVTQCLLLRIKCLSLHSLCLDTTQRESESDCSCTGALACHKTRPDRSASGEYVRVRVRAGTQISGVL
jgi:hypothetical protein